MLPVCPHCYRLLVGALDDDHGRQVGPPALRIPATPESSVAGARVYSGSSLAVLGPSIPLLLSQTRPFSVHVYWQGLACVTSVVASEAEFE
jgi:hypothetical protein